MKQCKRFLAVLLGVVCLLAGCKKESSFTDGRLSEGNGGDAVTGLETVATGRYVQQEVTPPALQDGYIENIRTMADGRILVLGSLEGQMPQAFVTVDGSSWEEFAPLTGAGILNEYPEHWKRYTVDDNGVWWIAAYTEAGDDNHLFKIQDGGHTEVPVGMYQSGNGGLVVTMLTDEDGTLLLGTQVVERVEWTLISAEGQERQSFRASSYYPTFTKFKNGKIYAISPSEAKLYVYDAAEGTELEAEPLPLSGSSLDWPIGDITQDGSLCYVNTDGIHKVALGGSYIQDVVTGAGHAFASSNHRAGGLVQAADGSFWLAGSMSLAASVHRYVFDENAVAGFTNSLYVWAMEDGPLLRTAVSLYAQQNPDSEVVVEYGRRGETAMTTGDIIRSLNTQLIAGDVPDVLILDELPVEAMIRQGILTDLTGLINEDEYFPGVIGSYKQDGATYAYPAMFWPVVLAQAETGSGYSIEAMRTLSDMQAMLCDTSQIYFGGYRPLFEPLYYAASPQMFPGASEVSEQHVREFFSVLQAAADAHGLANQEDDPLSAGYEMVDSVSDFTVEWSPSLSATQMGYSYSVLSDYAMTVILMWNHDANKPVGRFAPAPGNVFIPRLAAGVPVGAKDEQAGREFIRILMEDSQTVENIGLIQLDAVLSRRGVERAQMMQTYEDSLVDEFPVLFPNAEQLDLDSTLEQMEACAIVDAELYDKVYAQAKMLISGNCSLDEAVSAVLQNTKLYFEERK